MNRGDRLYPHWTSSSYCVLTKLRKVMELIITRHVAPLEVVSNEDIAVDLGCGTMPYRALFEPYVTRYIGVDLVENKAADLHFHPETFEVPLPNNTVKVIISTQVLEHVPNPRNYLFEARRLLNPDGIMILSTHGHWREHPDPYDYWRWTSEGLLKLLSDCGWKVVEYMGVLGFASSALQLLQQAFEPKVPHGLRRFFVVLMQFGVGMVDHLYSVKDRLHDASVFVVAAKPTRG